MILRYTNPQPSPPLLMLFLLLSSVPSITVSAVEQFVSTAFDNYHFECARISGIRQMTVSLVESQGAMRRDIVFSLTCEPINEIFPWNDTMQEKTADLERENCYYSQLIDPLIDDNTNFTCKSREYVAGVTRLSATRVQFLCCRLRTRTETNCTERTFQKPTEEKPKTDLLYEQKLINGISIKNDSYQIRFCELKPREMELIFKDRENARKNKVPKTTSTPVTSTTTTTPTTTTLSHSTTIVITNLDDLMSSINMEDSENNFAKDIETITFPSIDINSVNRDQSIMVSTIMTPTVTPTVTLSSAPTIAKKSKRRQNTAKNQKKNLAVQLPERQVNEDIAVVDETLTIMTNSKNDIQAENSQTMDNVTEFLDDLFSGTKERLEKETAKMTDNTDGQKIHNLTKIDKESSDIRRRESPSASAQRVLAILEAWKDRKTFMQNDNLFKKNEDQLSSKTTPLSSTIETTTIATFAEIFVPSQTAFKNSSISNRTIQQFQLKYKQVTKGPVVTLSPTTAEHERSSLRAILSVISNSTTKRTSKPVDTTVRPTFTVFTKNKKPEIKLQPKPISTRPSMAISAVLQVNTGDKRQRSKTVFKKLNKSYSQIVTSTLTKGSQNQKEVQLTIPDKMGKKGLLKDDPIKSVNSILRQWQFSHTDLPSSLHKKHEPNFIANNNIESKVRNQQSLLPGNKDGVPIYSSETNRPIPITEEKLKNKNQKYFGKKPLNSDDKLWNLDIFDDLESFSVDMPPETFSPRSIKDDLVFMSSTDDVKDNDSKISIANSSLTKSSELSTNTIRNVNDVSKQTTPFSHLSDDSQIPHDPSKFYHTPPPKRPPPKEKILTFCTKEVAIRDINNLVIACGDDFEVWRPRRCPEKTACFFSKDSTYRICCPVAEAAPAFRPNFLA